MTSRHFRLSLWFCLGWLMMGSIQVLEAGVVFRAPTVTVESDGVEPITGSFLVSLGLTGDQAITPPDVAAFNVDLSVNSADVKLSAAAPSAPLLTSGLFLDFSPSDQRILVAQDMFPNAVAAANGAELVEVSYEVAPGITGAFDLTFGVLASELSDATANPIALQFEAGALIVSQSVPAPAANLLTMLALALLLVRYRSRGVSRLGPPEMGKAAAPRTS